MEVLVVVVVSAVRKGTADRALSPFLEPRPRLTNPPTAINQKKQETRTYRETLHVVCNDNPSA